MVNIIIPVYKGKDTLPKTLDSLIAQTEKKFFVTIVQDCDGEDYSDIIKNYSARLHINLLSMDTNSGPGMARAKGLEASKMFDYIMFLDADDMLMPNAVSTLYKEAKRNNADIVSSAFIWEQTYASNRTLLKEDNTATWVHGKIYRTEYLRSKGINFIPELKFNEDAYFNLVALNSTDKIFYINETTHIWRDNKSSVTRSDKDFSINNAEGYIMSQIYGLLKLFEINDLVSSDLIAFTIINIYKHAMLMKEYDVDDWNLRHLYKKLFSHEKTREVFNNEQIINFFIQNTPIGFVFSNKKAIIYNTSIKDWLKSEGIEI